MTLDINTPRGRKSVEDELRAASLFEAARPGYSYAMTNRGSDNPDDEDGNATVDGVVIRGRDIIGTVEIKCREFGEEKLHGEYYKSRWLVTASKLTRAAAIATALNTPLWGFLYLVPDDVLLTQRLFDKRRWRVSIHTRRSTTPATCNGGTAERFNAYIDMSKATVLRREAP